MVDLKVVRIVLDRADPQSEPFELGQQSLDERGLARVALADDGDQCRAHE